MDINTAISAQDLANLTQQVQSFNKSLSPTKVASQNLGKDDFLKILLTQLSHQDPTQPLEDKEFVAQMAQFSSLEQMANMNAELGRVFGLLAKSQAVALLGKTVEISSGENRIVGAVEAVSGSEFPQILVQGRYYDIDQVQNVKQ
jgi:flagellar basal-body rod modification protein FlgD